MSRTILSNSKQVSFHRRVASTIKLKSRVSPSEKSPHRQINSSFKSNNFQRKHTQSSQNLSINVRKKLIKRQIAFSPYAQSAPSESLEKDLLMQLELQAKSEKISPEIMQVYQSAFEKVIDSDKAHSPLLLRIKLHYDQFIVKLQEDVITKDAKISKLENKLKEEASNYKKLNKRYKDLAFENIELLNNINELNKMYTERCSCGDTQDIATDFKKFRDKTNDKIKRITKKYQEIKLANLKFTKAFGLLRSRNIPVDDIIDEVSPLNMERLWLKVPSFQSCNSSRSGGSDPLKPKLIINDQDFR